LSRLCISLATLKTGTAFSEIDTAGPVRGFRPVRAPRFFAAKTPKPRSSTRFPDASAGNLFEHPINDHFDVALVQMSLSLYDAQNQF
jgi:hypothetical protein